MSAQVEKKLQPSRKGKKAWRKNIDMQPVDEALESLRVEERVRGEGTKIDDLFTIDTTGDLQVKRQLARDKPLRVDEILAERSAVPAVIARVKAANVERKESKHDLQKVNQIAKRKREGGATPAPTKKKQTKQATYDMWGDGAEEEEEDDSTGGYLDAVKERKVKAPSTLKSKPAALVHKPSVEVPHAGASYNPTMEDHQELLREAHGIETKKEEAIKKLNEQLSYRKELDQLKNELEESISDDDEEEEEEEAQKDEAGSAKRKSGGMRKTTTQRNKEKRKRYNRMLEEQKIHERDIRKQIDQVKAIEADLQAHIEKLEEVAEKRRQFKAEEEKKGSRRLGRHYIKEQSLEVQLQDELSETLRQLKVCISQYTTGVIVKVY
ncbi:ribosome biogenesis protein Nop53/GLTSCR2 [Zychaea mexicana]|uniref:ribosome biogenesis protein Nop53/GLTSCR2 n=1 Tax=Zychaea mexicana TaxID=64656 RepID=UPI0022FE6CCC|nr:ribosome biogenesis protein Nop53/GLTSCR2 [Zychaea mexicana]KAI9471430.1 ribosome biogenesis protein Nop53/GLTSCR2 [Zychaea mexicana]